MNIKYFFVSIIVVLVALCSVTAQNSMTYVYQIVSQGEVRDSVEWKVIMDSDKILLESDLDGTNYSYICNSDYSIRSVDLISEDQDYLHLSGEGKRILAHGRQGGVIINETIKRSKYPWYQNIGWAATSMLSKGDDEITFSLIRPDNLSVLTMQATVVEDEDVVHENAIYSAIKVKVTLTGILKHFWSGYYWYRKSDYKMVKYQGTTGAPGSPMLTMLLINEFSH